MEEKREVWDNKAQSYLALLGYVIGLGNIWRFPYLVFSNGGGAFLIPYILSAVFIGIPFFFIETAIGQFVRRGAIGVWKIAPVMKGIGLGTFVLTFFSNQYYNVVMAWSVLYFVRSMTIGALPWTTCDNWWNTNSCVSYEETLNEKTFGFGNSSLFTNETTRALPALEFWNNYVLRKSSGIEEMGSLDNWPLVLSLLAAWVICYFCTFRGTKSAGKVIYFTATFPYILIALILIKSLTLHGASDGIQYYLKPNISKLAESRIWVQAASQVLYSYGICFTSLITFGSYNRFNDDCYKMTFLITFSGSLTSFISGFANFAILGNLAYIQNVNVSAVATSGPGLVFISVPTVLSLIPGGAIWNILFFFMILLIGIDSQFACLEGMATCLVDAWPDRFRSVKQRQKLMAVICFIFFILGLVFCMHGGVYVFELYNNYAVSGFALLALAFSEAIAVGYIYGIDRFYDNVQTMIGYRPGLYIKICVCYISPVLIKALFIFYCLKYTVLKIDGYTYPGWAEGIGWLMTLASALLIPIWAFYKMFISIRNGSLKKRWEEAKEIEYTEHLEKVMLEGKFIDRIL